MAIWTKFEETLKNKVLLKRMLSLVFYENELKGNIVRYFSSAMRNRAQPF